jgi:two-component system, NtrC family, response regulator AtoC
MLNLQTLLVDDDRAFASLAAAALQREGFPVAVAHSLHAARKAVAQAPPELVILDRRLPDGDGLALLAELKAAFPSTIVVMVTAHGDVASAVDAVRAGAADYVVKPVELPDLMLRVHRSADTLRMRDRLTHAETELAERHRLVPPRSGAMRDVLAMLARIATTPRSPVLLLGETGVGKEVLARELHRLSAGESAPFVHVNCAALPESTVESELFGHEKGAFTDARATRRGLVELAGGGALFLDEVGELPLALQAKLLTFLDAGRYRRLGGTTEQTSTARIIAATNRDLEAAVGAGTFREDLWFRLSVFRIDVPPLRARRDDVLPLAEGILRSLAAELGRRGVVLGAHARERLLRYPFPGNVRELRNVLERAIVLEAGPELELHHLDGSAGVPQDAASSAFTVTGDPIPMEELERRYARFVLARLGGRRMDASKVLGLSYPTFLKRIED